MKLSNEERNALIKLRIERANETIKEIPYLIEQGFFRTAGNRLYYACFYIVNALFLKEGHVAHTHKGMIVLFAMHFVKTGIVSKEDGQLYRSLFELRQTGDYDDVKIISKEDVVTRLQPAKEFIDRIEQLILTK